MEGGIEFFNFAVLVTFEISFSVYAFKITGFLVLLSTVVFSFSLFDVQVSVFVNKKAVIRFLLFACLVPRPLHFTSVAPFWTVLGNVDMFHGVGHQRESRAVSGHQAQMISIKILSKMNNCANCYWRIVKSLLSSLQKFRLPMRRRQ